MSYIAWSNKLEETITPDIEKVTSIRFEPDQIQEVKIGDDRKTYSADSKEQHGLKAQELIDDDMIIYRLPRVKVIEFDESQNKKDLTNQQFDQLTVLRDVGLKHRNVLWECQCECGKVVKVLTLDLISGRSGSCGCLMQKKIGDDRKTITIESKSGHRIEMYDNTLSEDTTDETLQQTCFQYDVTREDVVNLTGFIAYVLRGGCEEGKLKDVEIPSIYHVSEDVQQSFRDRGINLVKSSSLA